MAGGFLGVLMRQTRFPRRPGGVDHAAGYGMPVRHLGGPGAAPRRIVSAADAALLARAPQVASTVLACANRPPMPTPCAAPPAGRRTTC